MTEKTDRELLELAAYAIGGTKHEPSFKGDHAKFTAQGFSGWFNPRQCTDHAAILSIRLKMTVSVHGGGTDVFFDDMRGGEGFISQDFGEDGSLSELESWRMAILRAAASIGEQMK